MIQGLYRIRENIPAAQGVYKMVLEGDTSAICAPGQFVNIRLDGFYTRRPISVCDYDSESITLMYKLAGEGTQYMSRLGRGCELDVLTGLGNGFDTSKSGPRPLLVGGGVGSAPLYGLCRALLSQGKLPAVIMGFKRAGEAMLTEEFFALGTEAYVTTEDGSMGEKGFVTDAMKAVEYTYLYVCGPSAMLRAVDAVALTDGQFSFEARMGCGFGACMSCSCKTRFGSKRICKDGPVFERKEILWQT